MEAGLHISKQTNPLPLKKAVTPEKLANILIMKKSNEPQLLYRHDDFIVVDKPGGWAVQGAENDLVSYYTKKEKRQMHTINRLDQPVSGITLLARSPKAAARFSNLQQCGGIQKKYLAIVEGKIDEQFIDIAIPLSKRGQKAVAEAGGKDAVTHAEVVWKGDRYTGLVVQCETGRFHQIRAHLAAIGHPIKGDLKYGSHRSEPGGGIYLHCYHLSFLYNGFEGSFVAMPPESKTLFQHFPASLFSTKEDDFKTEEKT